VRGEQAVGFDPVAFTAFSFHPESRLVVGFGCVVGPPDLTRYPCAAAVWVAERHRRLRHNTGLARWRL